MMNTTGIVVTGASGRMGQMLVRMIGASDKARLVGCVERAGHAWIGRDVGEALGGAALGVTVTDDPLAAFARAQAVIDFTAPAASVEFAALAAQARAVHVVGTTGLEAEHHRKLDLAAHHAVIIQAGNMSLGVNLLTRQTQKVAAAHAKKAAKKAAAKRKPAAKKAATKKALIKAFVKKVPIKKTAKHR